MHTTDQGAVASKGSGLTRRSVIKAGAHAAWMVPAVQVISAVPAFASCSTPAANGSFTFTGSWYWEDKGSAGYTLHLDYTITSTKACANTAMTLLLTAPSAWGGVQDHSTPKEYNAKKVGGGQSSDTWSFTPVQTSPTTWKVEIEIQVSDDQRHAGTITLSATMGGGTTSYPVVVTAT